MPPQDYLPENQTAPAPPEDPAPGNSTEMIPPPAEPVSMPGAMQNPAVQSQPADTVSTEPAVAPPPAAGGPWQPPQSGSPLVMPPVAGQPPVQPVLPTQSKKKVWLPLLVVVVVVIAAAIGVLMWNKQQHTPGKVFTGAFSKLLETKTITQTTSNASDSGSAAYDLTDVKNPKISTAVSIQSGGLTIKLNGYGTLQNNYLKFTTFGNSDIDAALGPIVNKWVQTRTNGVLADGVSTDINNVIDPRYMAFGDVIIGNFSAKDRQTLLNYIVANKIYAYDAKQVKTDEVQGKKVYVYPVTENVAKLKELNKMTAAIMGVPAADIDQALGDLGANSALKLYIDVNSKEIVRYTTSVGGTALSGSYTKYNTTSLPQEPKADLSWMDFLQREEGLTGGLNPFGG